MFGIIKAKFTLQTLSVESNVPVCGVVNEIEKSGNNCVKTIGYILLVIAI